MISQNGAAIICHVSKNTGNTGHFLKNTGIYRTVKIQEIQDALYALEYSTTDSAGVDTAENAFGLLGNRFSCLLTSLHQTPKTVESLALACIYLYN